MCSSRKILWSLLLLSVVEVGLGVASIVLGAVGISWVRGQHKPQQGDASPVWSGLCVRPENNFCPYFSLFTPREDLSPGVLWRATAKTQGNYQPSYSYTVEFSSKSCVAKFLLNDFHKCFIT
uniref:Transmembrane protein 196 n=1 Tax=Sander lucioperca TaxID=283035 RepID=A0A8C9ZSZ1_SANLU